MHAYLNKATKILRDASKILLRGYDNLESTPEKIDTQLHKLREKLEATVYTELLEAYPEHEFSFPGLTIKNQADIVWHIQVLSGEDNFRHGIPHFAMVVSIFDKNKIQHSLIFDPILQEIFTASRGANAQISRKRIRVSNTKEMDQAIIGSNINFNHTNLRQTGCAALQLAYVASGRLDGFVGKALSHCDLTAGSLLVKIAGGIFSDWQGDAKHEHTGELIASNPKLFKALLQQVNA